MVSVRSISRLIIFFISLSILFSFQNCNKVQFSVQVPEDLASSDFCRVNPSAPECLDAAQSICNFNGTIYREGQTVVAYLTSTVPYGQTCAEEIRTCTDGSFTGSYNFPTCNLGAASACLFNGQVVNNGDTVTSFQNSTVPFGSTCVSENRQCNDGTLTGSYNFGSCTVGAPRSCLFNGKTVLHGQSVRAFVSSTVPYGSTCTGTTRTCLDGQLTNSGDFGSCTVAAPASCLFDGQTVPHLGAVIGYLNANVPYNSSCQQQSRVCNNGVLSGNYNFGSCQVAAPSSCQFNGQTVASGQTVRAYQNSTVPFGSSCVPEDRQCNNGQLSGSYNFNICSVSTAASCSFNGQTVAHNATVTAYQNSSVPSGSNCVSQQRTCFNGTLSGTYNAGSCVVNAPVSCQFNGQTVPHGQNVTAFQASTVPYGQSCVSQPRTCNNGALSGTYAYSSCTTNGPASCIFNGQTIAHGQNITTYQSGSVAFGETCQSGTRTCNNGVLEGSGNFATCAVSGPANCLFAGRTLAHNEQIVAFNSTTVPYSQSCSQQTRTCNNGTMSGTASYQYLSCQAELPRSCTFNNQTVPHNSSVTGYHQSQVPYGQSCSPQLRTCSNGALGGTAAYASCTVLPQPCAPGETRNSAGVCVMTTTVNNSSSTVANSLCVDHNAFFQFRWDGNEVSLWAWGTGWRNNIVGWNCPDTVHNYYQYLPPLKIWSRTFSKGYRPQVSLSGSIYGGGGCNASGMGFGGYTRQSKPDLCPNGGAGTMQYGFDITITSQPDTGAVDGEPPYPAKYEPPIYYDTTGSGA